MTMHKLFLLILCLLLSACAIPVPNKKMECESFLKQQSEKYYQRGLKDYQLFQKTESHTAQTRAIQWLYLAALQGHLEAQALYGEADFGLKFFTGTAPEVDYTESLMFLHIATERGHKGAASFLSYALKPKVDIGQGYSPDQLNKAKENAKYWRTVCEEYRE